MNSPLKIQPPLAGLLVLLATAALCLPATSPAASAHAGACSQPGVVLKIDSAARQIDWVDAQRVVHGYRYSGHRPDAHFGSRVAYRVRHGRLQVLGLGHGATRSVSFFASIGAGSERSMALALGDGSRLRVPWPHSGAPHAGERVLVTESSTPSGERVAVTGISPVASGTHGRSPV